MTSILTLSLKLDYNETLRFFDFLKFFTKIRDCEKNENPRDFFQSLARSLAF